MPRSTLVVHDDFDAIVPFEISGRRSHEMIKGSSLALIEGGLHGLNATHADQFDAPSSIFEHDP